MQLSLAPEDQAFRDEVRRFLDVELDDELRAAGRMTPGVFSDIDASLRWQRKLNARGWAAPRWPVEWGGTGWSEVRHHLFQSALAEAEAPLLQPQGVRMIGPVLIGQGCDAQRRRYLPPLLATDEVWCQGYSEPGAGSDLASLKCRAVDDGDHYVITGSKIWTTHAHRATHMFALVRTSSDGKPQSGITFLLIDMATPGITVRPIHTMPGDHDFNEVFLDAVRVPKANRVGAENDGWSVAKYLLQHERASTSGSAALRQSIRRLRQFPLERRLAGRLTEVEIGLSALEMLEARAVSQMSAGAAPDMATAATIKLRSSDLSQRLTELLVEAMGPFAMEDQFAARQPGANLPLHGPQPDPSAAAVAVPRYFNMRASSIAGGTSEVQRSILAKQVLGL